MRIRTDGRFAYREALVDDVAEQLGENTHVGAVEASCEFTQAMLPALAKAPKRLDAGPLSLTPCPNPILT